MLGTNTNQQQGNTQSGEKHTMSKSGSKEGEDSNAFLDTPPNQAGSQQQPSKMMQCQTDSP